MKLCFETILDAPRDRVFAFFEDPNNLRIIHQMDKGFRPMHNDGNVNVGSTTWFEVNVAGILPIALGFRHTGYERNTRFIDELFHGPFSRFVHVHEFSDFENGTLVRDLIDISLPWYYGGEHLTRTLLGPPVTALFRARSQTLKRLHREGAIA